MPAQQRSLEADRTRVNDLREIAEAVKIWHGRELLRNPNAKIPPDLGTLVRGRELAGNTAADPITHAPYGYHPKTGNRYELCGNFSATNIGERAFPMHSGFWRYGKGETCFVLDASEPVPW
jgi:hypothetical protein